MTAYIGAVGACGILLRFLRRQSEAVANVLTVPLSRLLQQIEQKSVTSAVISSNTCAFRTSDGSICRTSLLPADTKMITKLMHCHGVEFRAQGPPTWRAAAFLMVPFIYLGLCSWLLLRMTSDNGFSGGREADSRAGEPSCDLSVVSWDDVAGIPKIKAQLREVVDIFLHPDRFTRMGARCPKGVLLAGPPGTGKTLLAKAIAGVRKYNSGKQ